MEALISSQYFTHQKIDRMTNWDENLVGQVHSTSLTSHIL